MSGCNCRKKSCKSCCPKTVRGPEGKRGPKGDTGNQGPPGPEGPEGVPANPVEIAFAPSQKISGTALTIVTGATTGALPAGNYAVWVENDWLNSAENTLGEYGIYVNGVVSGTKRTIGTTDPVTVPLSLHTTFKAAVFHIVAVGASEVIDFRYQLSAGEIDPKRGSIIYQKLS